MSEQARVFLTLVLVGMGAGLVYDFIRVFRRLMRHSVFLVQAEDLIFWLIFTLGVMMVLLWESNGVLRVFSVAAPIIGMVLYFGVFSNFFMKPAVAVTLFIKRIIMVIVHIFCIPLVLIGKLCVLPAKKIKKCLYKFNKIVKKLLKKIKKYEKIGTGFLKGKLFCFSKANGSDRVERRTSKEKKK